MVDSSNLLIRKQLDYSRKTGAWKEENNVLFTVIPITANPGKKETTDESGSCVNFTQKQFSWSCMSQNMVKWPTSSPWGLVKTKTKKKNYAQRPNVFMLQESCSQWMVVCERSNFTSYGKLNFLSSAIHKCTNPIIKRHATWSVCGFFLTWLV